MKAVTFWFQNLDPTLCLYRSGLAFVPFAVDVTLGKILNVWEKRHSIGKQVASQEYKQSSSDAKDSISANAQVSDL